MRHGGRLGLIGIMAAGAASCAASGSAWKESGYSQSAFGYDVGYRDQKTRALAAPGWEVDNHRYDQYAQAWQEKTGAEYVAVRDLDSNMDGSISTGERVKEAVFDLRLVNRRNNGQIWIKAHPLLPESAQQELEVMFDGYVEALSGHGLYAQGNLFTVPRKKARDFTTFPISKALTKIGTNDALTGVFEIAPTERLALDPKYRSGTVMLVMVKIRCFTAANCRADAAPAGPSDTTFGGAPPPADLQRWPTVDCRGVPCRARTGLLVIGYHNTPAHYAEGLPDLEDFLKRVSFPEALPLPVSPPAAIAKTAPPAPAPGPPAEPDPKPAAAEPPGQ
jgi:hypothetical protein